MFAIFIELLKDLLTGEFFRIWHEHKIDEAANAQNDANSMSDDDIAKQLRKWQR